jgi:hypothetical protein
VVEEQVEKRRNGGYVGESFGCAVVNRQAELRVDEFLENF